MKRGTQIINLKNKEVVEVKIFLEDSKVLCVYPSSTTVETKNYREALEAVICLSQKGCEFDFKYRVE